MFSHLKTHLIIALLLGESYRILCSKGIIDSAEHQFGYKRLEQNIGSTHIQGFDFSLYAYICSHADFEPTGDQPQAVDKIVKGLEAGKKYQTLMGVTGSGKTFTMANIIEKVQKPTLIISHNKTLAAQLYGEFKEFFPENAVEYFVSYYDYYQPEAYVASTDTYIEKDSDINDEIDKLRHSATAALNERRDVIVVASVSCIFRAKRKSKCRK